MAQDPDVNDALAENLEAAEASPSNDEAWDRLEALARAAHKTEGVAALYRTLLERPLPREVLLGLMKRAIAFQDEWGDEPATVRVLLERTLALDPDAHWAFDRISLELTASGQWEELLTLYDAIIRRTGSVERRAALLEEAAQVAKNSAGKPERAVDYLQAVFALRPKDALVASALERLLRQQNRYRDLITFWTTRLTVLEGEEAQSIQRQIALSWLEDLNDPAAALAAVEPLLQHSSSGDSGAGAAASELLAQILVSPASNAQARKQALARLSARWDATDRWIDLVGALRSTLDQVSPEERVRLHGEIAQRYLAHGQLAAALEDLAALIAADSVHWPAEDLDELLQGNRHKPVLGHAVILDAEYGRRLIAMAARIAQERLGDVERAALLLGHLLRDKPEDLEAIKRLTGLLEQAGKTEELLKLRQHELTIADSPRMKVYLRLEVARLLRSQGNLGSAVAVLRDNLLDQPNHEPTVRALVSGLEELGNFAELLDFLWAQAEAVAGTAAAVPLWHKAAQLAETQLQDLPRAQAAYAQVAAVREDAEVLEALARLHLAQGDHDGAIQWLSRRLAISEPGSRTGTIIELAATYRAAGKTTDAIRCLREGLEEDSTHLEMRQLLSDLYRQTESWDALAAALQEGAELVAEESKRFELLSEAADIYTHHLGAPERALSVLENARVIAPKDRVIRTRLADALRAAGRLDEAHALAQGLLEEMGRRRVPEKAAIHRLLAQIAEAKGDMNEALRELELAASMDVGSAQVQRMLGAAYSKVGQLEKAERAFQALLLILRRKRSQPGARPEGESNIGVAEALFEIHRVALELGDQARASEALESAFDAAAENDAEARWLERVLRTDGTPELLMRALNQRLASATDPGTRGEILAEKARVLDVELHLPDQALAALLAAVVELPRSAEVHQRCLDLARRLGALEKYREVLGRAVKRASDDDDWPLACDLLLRSGTLLERELANLDGAADLYGRAESTGQRRVEVWQSMARIAAARGDKAGELSALRNLAELPEATIPAEERIDVLYRLAELELGFPDSLYSGLETLKQALRSAPRLERAAEALRKPLSIAPQDELLVDIYEQVARDAWNDELLLDALQRRAELSGVTQALLEEAYGIAARLERTETAQSILLRAVEVARDEVADLSLALWALRLLIAQCMASGQLENAVHWMRETAEVAPPEEGRKLRIELASVAGCALNQLELAADTYEALLEDGPGDPTVWKPALEVVRRMGDKERFERLLTRVAEAVTDPHARSQLRIAKARLLLTAPGRQDDAILTLQQILDDDVEHAVAAELLADVLERVGRLSELVELLEKQIDLACERRSTETGVGLTLRLGHLLSIDRRDEAIAAYRALLDWVPGEPRVIEALYSLLDPDTDSLERADVLERLVTHLEQKEGEKPAGRAFTLALELVRLRSRLGDPAGMERALEHAVRQNAEGPEILEELRHLADRLAETAKKSDPENAAELLQKAADIHWNRLNNPSTAAELLTQAHRLQPTHVSLTSKLVRCLVEIGKSQEASAVLTQSLQEHGGRDPQRIRLLGLRANILSGAAEHAAAANDLEEAISLGAEGLSADLRQALTAAQADAHQRQDREAERDLTRRLAEVLRRQLGNEEEARAVLTGWLAQNPMDRDATLQLIELDTKAKRWVEVAAGYARLVRLDEGDPQTDAVVGLADAYEKAGTPEAARDIVESLYKLDPENLRLRRRLRRLYESIQAYRDLSNLLLVDANHASDDDIRFNLLREAGEIRLHKLQAAPTAIGPLTEAHDLRPTDHELTALLADAYVDAGFADDAVALLQTALDQLGDHRSKDLAHLQHRMARAVSSKGEPGQALYWLTTAWESFPQSGELASDLADRALALGEYELALKALRALAAMRTPAPISRPQALLKQATIAHLQGDERKAVFLAKKALAEDPSLDDAHAFLKKIQT